MIHPRHIELRSSNPALAPAWDHHLATWDALLLCDPTGHARATRPDGSELARFPDPLSALHWMSTHPIPPDTKWVGYLSYDLGRFFEHLPSTTPDDLSLPLFAFVLGRHTPPPPLPPPRGMGDPPMSSSLTSTFTRQAYLRAVQRAIDYISAGDIFQVNLSQRFTTPLLSPPEAIFHRLQHAGGAWYGALLDFTDFALLSNSPELFLSVTPHPDGTRTVTTRPIKGTRPHAPGMAAELLASEKDQAELNMIIDLERNDLGRVCQTGSVRVTRPRSIETHPTVHHGVATVQGTLRPDVTLVDLLRATFPGGSITGAPKIRAMQIIDELEPTKRGPYCGAIGSLSPDGHLELNIAIRTMLITNHNVHIPVGGGIVADSTPQSEYAETLVKARALFNAIGIPLP